MSGEDIVTLGVALSRCVCVCVALVSAAKVMRCVQCSLVYSCDSYRQPIVKRDIISTEVWTVWVLSCYCVFPSTADSLLRETIVILLVLTSCNIQYSESCTYYRAFADRRGYLIVSLSRITTWPMLRSVVVVITVSSSSRHVIVVRFTFLLVNTTRQLVPF